MKEYSVNKYYGHFWQNYTIMAESKEDAWERAEIDGKLFFQNVYRELKDLESKGFVVDVEENRKNDKPISNEEYWKWMQEAIDKGMKISKWEQIQLKKYLEETNARKD